ncbi:hypothetical protein [Bacillus halotolerans]|uniref:DUF4760 domain-containing protein n=1 Tax=Bacillus halotolerans TaxID=260554 RepID=A0A9Q6A6Z7_9BACI|nr:hypothetical protein [Bacillus halotolerans]PLS05143.1 hypothetical protein CUU63_17015 [Bacillus halotolerans]
METISTCLKDYGALLGSIVAVILTSILVMQRNKLKRNETILTESLMEASGSLFFTIKSILNKVKITDITEELKEFFDKYSKNHNSIVKLKDKHIVKRFVELEELYYVYLSEKTSDNLDRLMTKFVILKNDIEQVFYTEHKVVNKEIRWYLIVESKENVWFRMLLRGYRYFSHTVIFAAFLDIIMVYLTITDRFSEEHLLEEIYGWVFLFSQLISILLVFVLFVNFMIHLTEDEKDNWGTKFCRFIIPKRLVQRYPFLRRFTGGDKEVNSEKRAIKEYEEKYKQWINRERR